MSKSAAAACATLTTALPERVITPDNAEYESVRDFPWSNTCWLPAACYVRPRTTDEVAIAVKAVKEAESQFTIRGGGHNCNPNLSSTDSTGVVIDLHDLNTISIDKSRRIAKVAAGSTWGQVYTFLEEYGLTAIGGRQKDVGVGGYLLGGGLPAFSNLHGLGADSIVNFEVVLADSTIVNANQAENPDLYRALKGGGTNFGIVTRFDIQTYEIKAQYTLNIYDRADYANILRATVELQKAMETDPKYGLVIAFYPTMCVVGLLYADWVSETPKAFEPFMNLKSLQTSMISTTNGTIKSLADAFGPATHLRRHCSTATTKVSYDLYLDTHKHWLAMLEKHPGAAVAQLAEVRGGNALGVEPISQSWWAFVAEWSDQENDAAGYDGINELCSGIRTIAEKKGQLLDLIFMNDASVSQGVLASYGADNVKRLRETAAKYDPEGFFQKQQKDGFLLRKL